MSAVIRRPLDPSFRRVEPRSVKVVGTIGPFIGMSGTVVAEDAEFVWVRFEQGGSYAPCDQPGTYGLQRDQLVPGDRTDRLPPTNVSRKESHEG